MCIKTLTVELVGIIVAVAKAIASFTSIDASVVAAPLATGIAIYSADLKVVVQMHHAVNQVELIQ
jgi:hypothetical protein